MSSSTDTICHTEGCGKPASLKCPTCIQYGLSPATFCCQDCFKASWKKHNEVHKLEKAKREFVPAPFNYTGTLRPAYVTPMRTVPDNIQKPDYAITGEPKSEMETKLASKILIYTDKQIQGIRAACRIGREVLDIAARAIRPGITTEEIDVIVHKACVEKGAYPSPLNYRGFPKSCCTSINEVICHGIPDARPLQDGDIVNIDISVYYKGYHGDLNETYCVGTKVDDNSKKLIKTTYESLMLAVQHVKTGNYFREFGDIITKHVTKEGFSVVRSYCGHGIGELFHCAPSIPHYSKNKAIGQLKPGMIFTIEPMINAGSWRDELWPDDWTAVTADGKRSAQFEHTLLVTETGVEVLTGKIESSPKFFWEEEGDKKQ